MSIFRRSLRTLVAQSAKAVISNSNSGWLYWKKKRRLKSCYVIPNAVPVEEIQRTLIKDDNAYGIEVGKKLVLYAGRLDPQKNVGALLVAMGHVPSDIKLILCGSGPLEAVYRGQIKSLCLEDRVILPGRTGKERVWSLMRKAGTLALVSHHEGFPNVLVEAMFNRCPLIVSDIPPHREFLDETTACFVNKDDPKEISQGIMRTLEDPQGNTMQIDKAFQLARQFTIERMVDEYEAIYLELLRKG